MVLIFVIFLKETFFEDSIRQDNIEASLDRAFVLTVDKSSKTPKSLSEFIKTDGFFDKIKLSPNVSTGELFYMSLVYSLSNHSSITATINLFKLINNIFESPVLPDSKYIFDNILNCSEIASFHAVCHNCSRYLGVFNEVKNLKTCIICLADLDLTSPSKTCFFALINPSLAIADLLKKHEDYYDFIMNTRHYQQSHFKDIYDGQQYREFVNSLPNDVKKKIFHWSF